MIERQTCRDPGEWLPAWWVYSSAMDREVGAAQKDLPWSARNVPERDLAGFFRGTRRSAAEQI